MEVNVPKTRCTVILIHQIKIGEWDKTFTQRLFFEASFPKIGQEFCYLWRGQVTIYNIKIRECESPISGCLCIKVNEWEFKCNGYMTMEDTFLEESVWFFYGNNSEALKRQTYWLVCVL